MNDEEYLLFEEQRKGDDDRGRKVANKAGPSSILDKLVNNQLLSKRSPAKDGSQDWTPPSKRPPDQTETSRRPTDKAANATDDAFIEQYYARSRLHLISTLAQEMKEYVEVLRSRGGPKEAELARSRMLQLMREEGFSRSQSR